MEDLTKAEEKVMKVLWHLKKAFVHDIIAQLPDPKPPYNTISSVVRVLTKKGFTGFKAYGKTYEYYPQISQNEYRLFSFKKLLSGYFDGSYEKLVSFMVDKEEISEEELNKIRELIESKKAE